jgi:hypothetical protein
MNAAGVVTKRASDSDYMANGKYDMAKIVSALWTAANQSSKQGVYDIVKIIQ